nr:hypothetical protein [Candidatus Woesebacteria bacterium]
YPAGVVKTMLKALQNGGVIDPLSFVQDSIGMLYAVMGGVEERNSVVELLKETLVSASKAGLLPDLVIKSRGNTTSKPTSTRNGMERFNVFLENSPVPVEIIVRSLPEFLDAEYHTGTCNPETGKWNGASHELFEIYRLMDLIPIFFPSDLYSHVGSDPTQSAHEHAQRVVQNLLTSHAIVLP